MSTPHHCPRCGKPLAADAPLGLCPACLLNAGFPTNPQTSATGATTTRRTAFTPPTPAELAPLFPQLEILELIGQGGMGAVYQARQPSLDRFVALKILPPQTDNDPGFTERFAREARALARLNHPNIVSIYDFGQAGSFHFFVMEYMDGANLRQVERVGKLTPREALQIIPQVCSALQFAHDEGIVHRDIKPENILLDKKGRVKIADFGLAKIFEPGGAALPSAITQAGHVMGTPHYMAPEQVERPLAVDHRADIYSLGVVFYEMLTGELPLGRFAAPSQRAPMDARLDDVVMRTLEKEPAQRYQQAGQVKTDVETIARGEVPPVMKQGSFPPHFFRRAAFWFLAGFMAVSGVWFLSQFNRPLIYRATASLQVLRPTDNAGDYQSTDATALNTRISLMESHEVATRVANMMTEEEKRQFRLPYKNDNPLVPETPLVEQLLASRTVTPGRLAYIIKISVGHPDPVLAAKVANYFVEALIEYNQSRNAEKTKRSVAVLTENLRQQQKKIADLQDELNRLVEKYGMDNLDQDRNVLPSRLAAAINFEQADQNTLDLASGQWQLVQQYHDEGKNLWDLSFVASDQQVLNLRTELANLQLQYANKQQVLGPNHPEMVTIKQQEEGLASQLDAAANSVAERVHNDYLAAQEKFNKSKQNALSIQQRIQDLSTVQAHYSATVATKVSAEAMLVEMQNNIERQSLKVIDSNESIVPIDRAQGNIVEARPPAVERIAMALTVGAASGLLIALIAAGIIWLREKRRSVAA